MPKLKVTLVDYTKHALELLIFTKSTRLKMGGDSLQQIVLWPQQRKLEELNYMLGTIKSSWEFAEFTFSIENVSRAFTHQLVRHRIGTSFAQQSQRTVDMTGFEYVESDALCDCSMESAHILYRDTMDNLNEAYQALIGLGAKPEDARGVLPTNVCTNIIFKANLRTLHGMAAERLCVKAQGEFQGVMEAMRERVIEVYPWAEPMLRVGCAATGVCIFPHYQNCPIKGGIFNPETGHRYDGVVEVDGIDVRPNTKEEIQTKWLAMRRKVKHEE